MTKINIGQDYALDIGRDLQDLPTPWVLNKQSGLHPKYVVWGDLNGKIVTAKRETRILTKYVLVVLKKGPKEEFSVPQSCLLEITMRLPIVCCCETRALVAFGCKCGAFQREKRRLLDFK